MPRTERHEKISGQLLRAIEDDVSRLETKIAQGESWLRPFCPQYDALGELRHCLQRALNLLNDRPVGWERPRGISREPRGDRDAFCDSGAQGRSTCVARRAQHPWCEKTLQISPPARRVLVCAGVMGDAWAVAKKLKVFRTSMGFFEIAIAAPSMKAAAEAWGVDPDIFRRGFAEQTEDKKIVEAAMAAPGVVLRRPVGSDGAFGEKAALPDAPADTGKKQPAPRPDKVASKSRPDPKLAEERMREKAAAREREETAAREKEAAAAREKEERRRELERRKKEAEEERARKQREQKIAKANAAFERAKARHDEAVQSLTKQRKELDDDQAREDERWEREQREHRDALREAE